MSGDEIGRPAARMSEYSTLHLRTCEGLLLEQRLTNLAYFVLFHHCFLRTFGAKGPGDKRNARE